MRILSLIDQQKRLERLFAKAESIGQDEEILANWARYLCVLTCGFVEVSMATIFHEYTKGKSSPNIQNFVSSRLRRPRTVRMEDILQLAAVFNRDWRTDIEKSCTDEMRDAVASILDNRDHIAHGVDVGLSMGRMKRYYEDAVKLVELVENVVMTS